MCSSSLRCLFAERICTTCCSKTNDKVNLCSKRICNNQENINSCTMPTYGDVLCRHSSHTDWFTFVLTVIYEIFREFYVIEPDVIKRAQPLTRLEKNPGLKMNKTMIKFHVIYQEHSGMMPWNQGYVVRTETPLRSALPRWTTNRAQVSSPVQSLLLNRDYTYVKPSKAGK